MCGRWLPLWLVHGAARRSASRASSTTPSEVDGPNCHHCLKQECRGWRDRRPQNDPCPPHMQGKNMNTNLDKIWPPDASKQGKFGSLGATCSFMFRPCMWGVWVFKKESPEETDVRKMVGPWDRGPFPKCQLSGFSTASVQFSPPSGHFGEGGACVDLGLFVLFSVLRHCLAHICKIFPLRTHKGVHSRPTKTPLEIAKDSTADPLRRPLRCPLRRPPKTETPTKTPLTLLPRQVPLQDRAW